MYKDLINEQSVDIEINQQTLTLNNRITPFSLIPREDGGYETIIDGQKMIVDIVKIDKEQKQIILRIQNKRYTVQIKEPVDLMLEKLGIQTKSTKKINHLKAPMPGLVTKIFVAEGDVIKQGEPLLILEAMKMENVFKAASDVIIKSIIVGERQAVEKGEVLIAFV